ncbi:MAG TPA: hypothetical protein VFS10_19545 [Pyrinomonadaceae bacterium]|nr:hypothetical protein [Pyrinomonadaceae bacterium]
MCLWDKSRSARGAALVFVAALFVGACQQPTVNENTTGTPSAATNINSANSANVTTSDVTTNTGTTIETKEPDKYSATVVVEAAAAGQQQAAGKTEVKVARNGADRRYSIDTRIPGLGEIIFLDKADKRYLILPARKQYAELTAELTGFDVGRSLTPGQLVAYLERQQGVTRVGDESLDGRMTTKYRLAGAAQTGTQAGSVQGESFVYVDKETGLPLRIEGFGQSSGNVQGVSGGKLTARMIDLKTEVDAAQFELPQGFSLITQEQLRQQTAQLMQFVQGIMNMLNAQQQGAGTSSVPPPPPPSPAATR